MSTATVSPVGTTTKVLPSGHYGLASCVRSGPSCGRYGQPCGRWASRLSWGSGSAP
jgi:hypothetical protein